MILATSCDTIDLLPICPLLSNLRKTAPLSICARRRACPELRNGVSGIDSGTPHAQPSCYESAPLRRPIERGTRDLPPESPPAPPDGPSCDTPRRVTPWPADP